MSGVAYFITLVRERWTRVELKEMEKTCANCAAALRANGRAIGRSRMKAFVRRRRRARFPDLGASRGPAVGSGQLVRRLVGLAVGLMVALIQAFSLAQFLDPQRSSRS